jgi:hypothetical protein
MKTKRRYTKNKSGGFLNFFSNKVNPDNSAQCNPNNLTSLTDVRQMQENYQTCCPKTWYGSKNSSPYCKQLDLNFKGAQQREQMVNQDELQGLPQQVNPGYAPPQRRRWYGGGRKTNKSRKTRKTKNNKKRSYRKRR